MFQMNRRDLVGGWNLPPKLCFIVIFVGACLAGSEARDLGAMEDQRSPAITMVPRAHAAGHNTTRFLLRKADAYWADQVRVGPNGEIIATITDDRDDGPLKRNASRI